MKRILLIIAITFCIFQMVVLATDIDIGSAAINRAGLITYNCIYILKDNPANANGKITNVEIWAGTSLSNCEIATFYSTDTNQFSTRDYEFIGSVASGSKKTFEVDLDVEEGDYIGMFSTGGYMECTETGCSGVWINTTATIPCTTTDFSFTGGYTLSLYGTGTTEVGVKDNALFFGMNF